jgi:quinol monooxygenase YgiN
MVKVVIMCDVPKEKQEEFLKLFREGTKPYMEAHGVISYDVWKTDEEGFGQVSSRRCMSRT